MSWEFQPAFDAGHRAALAAGKSLVYVCPPAGWTVLPLLDHWPEAGEPGLGTVILVPQVGDALELADDLAGHPRLQPVHPVTGLARAARLLHSGAVRTLVGTPADVLQLLTRSAFAGGAVTRIVVGWPEDHEALGQSEQLDLVLGELAAAQRLIATSDPAVQTLFLQRHAHRAPVVRAAPLPERPGVSARYAVADQTRRTWTARAALDVLNPASALLWDPRPGAAARWQSIAADPTVSVVSDPGASQAAVALAVALPSADALVALTATAREVVVLVTARQLPYLRRITTSLKVLHLPGEADRARARATQLRARLRERIASDDLTDRLLALAPLFDEHDPAIVAAAALALDQPPPSQATEPAVTVPLWAIIRLSTGRRDRVRPGDVVGALLNAVGLSKDKVGRVDVRDSFTLVDVRAEEAERACSGLDGITLRGQRVSARMDVK